MPGMREDEQQICGFSTAGRGRMNHGRSPAQTLLGGQSGSRGALQSLHVPQAVRDL